MINNNIQEFRKVPEHLHIFWMSWYQYYTSTKPIITILNGFSTELKWFFPFWKMWRGGTRSVFWTATLIFLNFIGKAYLLQKKIVTLKMSVCDVSWINGGLTKFASCLNMTGWYFRQNWRKHLRISPFINKQYKE